MQSMVTVKHFVVYCKAELLYFHMIDSELGLSTGALPRQVRDTSHRERLGCHRVLEVLSAIIVQWDPLSHIQSVAS